MVEPRWIVASLVGVLLAGAAPPAAAAPSSADEALARQQRSLRAGLGLDCDRGGGSEIVVCGRTGPDPYRLSLPVEPEPGARTAGEPTDPVDSLALTKQRCTTVGPNQQCGGGLPIVGIALWLARTAVKAAKDEE